MHAACALVLLVGWSPTAIAIAAALYVVRMFGVTAFYHRYFSHRSFRVGRLVQFGGAVLGASAAQRGPLWWAAHHRRHHRHADTGDDVHSPHAHGVLWSHVGWIAAPGNQATDLAQVRDLAAFPELRWLDRNYYVVPLLLIALLLALGWQLSLHAPQLGTDALQLAVWGFCISTVALFHVTSAVNSLGHVCGRRVWPTRDHSRNSLSLALLTLGEGWHNNHHWCPGAVRQGFRWWEIDISYYVLRLLALLGLVHDLRPLPARAHAEERRLRR
ncbi:MAG: acyl-CoA desaturase [Planctomycetes bacterium]|nr:acyl-CoA desaturase [Planctomycetota bacterium]